ncbi:MAG: ribonuclease H-like domain-containing protein [Planctomycetota bacterium]|nr:ribonuclease H-like domain-containing protein [Planctomycetota bacterium]
MRLVDKLRRIAAPAEIPRRAPGPPGARRLPGGVEESESGPVWIRRARFPVDTQHGSMRLRALRDVAVKDLSVVARDPGLEHADFDKAIFFDTETTSLGGGVGTYVFLLGAGYMDGDSFVVEQYFLREMTEERALLGTINRLFGRFELAVSFHGKGFDTPRLTDRLAFHHMQFDLPDVHLDLCQVGRQLYRGAFEDCRLQTFERELVRFHRQDDLPGADCPRAFFDHLRGDSSLIPRVFQHNLYDILTMPALAACFAREVSSPSHPVVQANLGRVYESSGRDDRARRAYGASLPGLRERSHGLLPRTLERLALLERRTGRHAESAELLQERVGLEPAAIQALEDLAKYYEHRRHDYERACELAREARRRLVDGVEGVEGGLPVDPAVRERRLQSLEHRLERLQRRVSFRESGP